MKPDDSDTTIDDIHRIRREIAAKFAGDLFAISADARDRTEKSGREIIRRSQASNQATSPTGRVAHN